MLYHGERFPHFVRRSNFLPFVLENVSGVTSKGAPVCTGYEGAVATTAGSAPVGVFPA
jgi:hypothetical protein